MAQNGTGFVWTKARAQAAVLLAEDALSDEQISDRLGIGRRTLARWKEHPDFTARIAEHAKKLEEAALRLGIARRTKRVEALHDRWQRMKRVIDERAEDSSLETVAGGGTGLIVRQVKSIGFGENNQLVEEYAVDTGLLRELRAHEEQAAKELGQWIEKREDKLDATGAFLNALKEFGHGHSNA